MDDRWTLGDWVGSFFYLAVILFGIFAIRGCIADENTPEYKAQRAAEIKDCETPKIVSTTPDGTQLWSVRPHCYPPVYFSKSGTQWDTEERHGKTTETVTHRVPASE